MKTHKILKEHCGKTYLIQEYYNRSMRLWVAYKIDEHGNQVADCAYDIDKSGAAYLACEKKLYTSVKSTL